MNEILNWFGDLSRFAKVGGGIGAIIGSAVLSYHTVVKPMANSLVKDAAVSTQVVTEHVVDSSQKKQWGKRNEKDSIFKALLMRRIDTLLGE